LKVILVVPSLELQGIIIWGQIIKKHKHIYILDTELKADYGIYRCLTFILYWLVS